MLAELREAGFAVSAAGEALFVEPASKLTGDQRSRIRSLKPTIVRALLRESAQEEARANTLSRLAESPYPQRAFVTRWEDSEMIVTLAVRGVGTCELSIPRSRFDGDDLAAYGALIECIDRAGGCA